LKEALKNLTSNATLTMALTTMPGFIMWMSTEWGCAGTKAHQTLFGSTPASVLHSDPAAASAVGMLSAQLMEESVSRSTHAEQMQYLEEFTKTFERFSYFGGQLAFDNVNNLLKAIVLQATTAFEVVASDSYYAALALRPAIFPPLDPAKLPSFSSRKRRLDVYRKGFKVDRAEIKAQLENPDIDAICLTRNVITHKGGTYDDEFIKYASGVPLLARLAPFTLHRNLLLDGITVGGLVRATFSRAVNLIVEVDKWLQTH
jgi:hypothetical protein